MPERFCHPLPEGNQNLDGLFVFIIELVRQFLGELRPETQGLENFLESCQSTFLVERKIQNSSGDHFLTGGSPNSVRFSIS